MKNRQILAWCVLPPFLLLTAYALLEVGYLGLFSYQFHSPAGWQVLVDLVIALLLMLTWLVPEARKAGRNPWPWVVGTLLTGSVAPLVFLATQRRDHNAINAEPVAS